MQKLHEGGFARTTGPYQSHSLPRFHYKTYALYYFMVFPVMKMDIVKLYFTHYFREGLGTWGIADFSF